MREMTTTHAYNRLNASVCVRAIDINAANTSHARHGIEPFIRPTYGVEYRCLKLIPIVLIVNSDSTGSGTRRRHLFCRPNDSSRCRMVVNGRSQQPRGWRMKSFK
jgi:hypothetical protein